MKDLIIFSILLFVILVLLASIVWAEENDILIALRVAKEFNLTPYQTRLLLSIRCAEDGGKGKEYGVLSVPASTQLEQAKVTARSIINNWKRWEKAGKPGDFINFISRQWCPNGVENDSEGLNRFWVPNVRYYMEVLE